MLPSGLFKVSNLFVAEVLQFEELSGFLVCAELVEFFQNGQSLLYAASVPLTRAKVFFAKTKTLGPVLPPLRARFC